MSYAQKMWKRVLSMVLAVVITLTIIPVTDTYAATPNSVELDQSEVKLEGINSTAQIAISAVYDDAANQLAETDYTVEWTSTKPTIARVENGTVTAVGAGETTVNVNATYTDADGNPKTSSGSVTVKVYVTPTVTITATTGTTVSYPTPVKFDIECESATDDNKELKIVKDGETTPISYTIGDYITLDAGTYKLTANVDANEYYREASAEMTYVVEKAQVTGAAISSIPEKLDCDEEFVLDLPKQKKADETDLVGTYQIEITGLDAAGAALENVEPETKITLKASSTPTAATVKVTFNPKDNANYAAIEYPVSNINVQVISVKKSDDISLDSEVFWGDKLELKLPAEHTAENGDQVKGTYDVTVTGLKAVDANNQEITNLTGINPTTIYLNADTVTNGKVTINFVPTSTKYADVSYDFSVKIKAIPVKVSWDVDVYEKVYNGESTYILKEAPTISFVEEKHQNLAVPGLKGIADPANYEFVFDLEAGSKNARDEAYVATLNQTLELDVPENEANCYVLTTPNPEIKVKINPVMLSAENIEFTKMSGKQYDGTSSAQDQVTAKLINPDNIVILNTELNNLTLSYVAQYYDASGSGAVECGDPEATVNARIKLTDLKVIDANNAENYKFTEVELTIEDKLFSIASNDGFIKFTGLDLGDPVTDIRDVDGDGEEEKVDIYWFNSEKIIEAKDANGDAFTFSANPTGTSWEDTYKVKTSEPTKIYAKDASGLVSGGIYVAMDTTKPLGDISALVLNEGETLTDENKDNAISIKELINQYKTLETGKNIFITFAGSDSESEISKIEIYGSDSALEINVDENATDEDKEKALESAWANITGYEVIDDINSKEKKEDFVSHVVEIDSKTELKKFYYVKITDYAGNVSYISSSGVLQDITPPTAEIKLVTATDHTFNGKNVYGEDGQKSFTVEFSIDLNDPEKASGISEVTLELKNAKNETIRTIEISDVVWKESPFKTAIINLPDVNSTDAQINAAKNGTLVGALDLEDGFYTLTVVAIDNVKLSSEPSSVGFIVDNTAPEIIIENNLSFMPDKVQDNLYTGGTIKVTVKELTLTTSLEDLLSGTGIEGKDIDWTTDTDDATGLKTYTAELAFGEERQFKEGTYDFTVSATDSTGETTETDSKEPGEDDVKPYIGDKNGTFIIDYTAPVYSVEFSKTSDTAYKGDTGKLYYGIGTPIEATFTIAEETTYDDNLITISVMKDGEEVIKWEKAENSTTAVKTVPKGYTFAHDPGSKTFVITIPAESAYDGEYTFEITGIDKAGNALGTAESEEGEASVADEIAKVRVMDATAPELTGVTYVGSDGKTIEFNEVKEKLYTNKETTVKFTVDELNLTPDSEYTIIRTDNEEQVTTGKHTWSDNGESEKGIVVAMLEDGVEQKITLYVVDKAGNKAVLGANTTLSNKHAEFNDGLFADTFTVDTKQPEITLEYVDFTPNKSGDEAGDGVDYFKHGVTVKATVKEYNFDKDLFTQNVKRTNSKVAYTESGWTSNGDKHEITFTFTKDNQYDLSITGTDNALNELTLATKGTITAKLVEQDTPNYDYVFVSAAVDKTLPEIGDTANPIIVIKPSSPQNETTDGQALYNSDVTYKVVVYDPLVNDYASGIHDITFEISGEDGTTSTCTVDKDGVIKDGNGVSITRVGGSVTKRAQGAKNKYTFNVTLSSDTFNTNGIVLSVSAVDFSTNLKEDVEADPIAIDVTAPKVLVTYDNNDVSNEKYFHADRIATVQVTERNFSNDCLQFIINGQPVELNFTLQSQGSGNRDNAVWVATYAFTIDGDYKIDVKCVDRAQNEGTVEYEGAAPQDFTIDKTFPIITVVYDNNDFQNEYYYKEARTATITIEEHNFASADVVITLTAEDDGQIIEVPAVNGWASEGDLHTATINYNYDAEFTFDIEYADLATNEAEDYEMDRFVIDMTAPELEIFDIEHMSANNGVVRPGVRYYDTNYDQDGTVILMTGYHNGVVEMTGSRTLEENGLELKLDDFAYVQEMDDLYTMEAVVYDLAGNSSEEMVMFSVNRFGSVYTFDEPTDALIGDEGRYYTNKEQQLVIMETNVDTLEFKEITMNLNGTLTTLKEGVDYTVGLDGNEATWKQYTYTLKADNFVEEGTYILTIYSEDRATNTSDNNTKGKKIEFVVDKTNPSALISGVENGGQYRTNSKEMTIDVEDNVRLSQVTVTIDGVETVYDAAQIDEANGKLVLNIGNANHWQDVKVVVTDAAGNQDVSEEIRVLVTANIFVQFFMNKPVFYGTLGGGAVLAALLWWFLVGRKRRNEEEQAQ